MKTIIGICFFIDEWVEDPDISLAPGPGRDARRLVEHHGDVMSRCLIFVKRHPVSVVHEVGHGAKCLVDFGDLKC